MLFYRNYKYIVYYSDHFGVLIGCCVIELYAKLCPHHNVWPEIVYCCFTRTTLFTELFTYLYDREVAITSPSFALHLLVSEIAKCIA